METQTKYTELGWKILFNEDFEDIPDPNRPENSARINAEREKYRQVLLQFVEGPGAPLYQRWKEKIKRNTLGLLATPLASECNCMSCMLIREIQYLFKLLLEAQEVIETKHK